MRFRFVVVVILLLAGSAVSGGYSVYWFSQSFRMRQELARLQQKTTKEAESVMMILGMMSGAGPRGMDLMAVTAVLAAERQGFQFLSLALALGFPGLWLLPAARSKAKDKDNARAARAASGRSTARWPAAAKDELRLKLEKLDREWTEEKERRGSVAGSKLRQLIGSITLLAAFPLVCIDWLWLANDIRLDRAAGVCMGLGVFFFVGSAGFLLSTGGDRRRIRLYDSAEQSYRHRRSGLLQDIEASSGTLPCRRSLTPIPARNRIV
jgi:hypothetical protein